MNTQEDQKHGALSFKEASLKVLTCRRPAAVLEASREKTSGTQDSKEQKRLSLSGKGRNFSIREV